jgi:hypothetical protein
MQKDGTYRVVYGTKLDKITGRVKLSVVGYGRKTQEGGDTLLVWYCELLPPKCLPLCLRNNSRNPLFAGYFKMGNIILLNFVLSSSLTFDGTPSVEEFRV